MAPSQVLTPFVLTVSNAQADLQVTCLNQTPATHTHTPPPCLSGLLLSTGYYVPPHSVIHALRGPRTLSQNFLLQESFLDSPSHRVPFFGEQSHLRVCAICCGGTAPIYWDWVPTMCRLSARTLHTAHNANNPKGNYDYIYFAHKGTKVQCSQAAQGHMIGYLLLVLLTFIYFLGYFNEWVGP